LKKDGHHGAVAELVVADHQHLGELVRNQQDERQTEPGQHAATRAANPGCWCSARRWWVRGVVADVVAVVPAALALHRRSLGVTWIARVVAVGHPRLAEVMVTNFRSSPSERSKAASSAPA
jgi:hypothetical protein